MDTFLTPGLVRAVAGEARLQADRSTGFLPKSGYLRIGTLSLLLALLAGCSQPTEPVEQAAAPGQESDDVDPTAGTIGTINITQLPGEAEVLSSSESWHANYMQGKKIGYRHTQVRELQIGEQRLMLTNILEQQSMLRFGEKITLEISGNQLQDVEGNIVQFSFEIPLGLGSPPMRGVVTGEHAMLSPLLSRGAKPRRIRFPEGTRGFDGVEQSLLESPMQPGDTRSLKMLQIPPLKLISDVQLRATEREKITLPAGEVELLRIEQQVAMPSGGEMLIELWTDEKGEVLKYAIPQMQQETFLTTKELALDERDATSFDLGTDTLIRLQEPLEDPHQAQSQNYQVTWKTAEKMTSLPKLFSQALSQEVWSMENALLAITVKAIRPDQPAELSDAQAEPTEADRQPSPLVQSDDPEIVKLAESATQGAETDWDKATALEKFVNGYLTEKNYSQAFASAADVAQSQEGDCTEHAVLLAALCRAEKIPARVAFGLVYVAGEQAFAFHMWNEVWIHDRWIPLDATLALGGIGAGHLQMGTSALGDMSALLDLLPVMQAMGKIKITALPEGGKQAQEKAAQKK